MKTGLQWFLVYLCLDIIAEQLQIVIILRIKRKK